jgi:hypothetical protein
VKGRSIPFQPYFESGFPYGHDQWISAAATNWATMALAPAVEAPDARPSRDFSRHTDSRRLQWIRLAPNSKEFNTPRPHLFKREVQPVTKVSGEELDGSELIRKRPSRAMSYWKPARPVAIMRV